MVHRIEHFPSDSTAVLKQQQQQELEVERSMWLAVEFAFPFDYRI